MANQAQHEPRLPSMSELKVPSLRRKPPHSASALPLGLPIMPSWMTSYPSTELMGALVTGLLDWYHKFWLLFSSSG